MHWSLKDIQELSLPQLNWIIHHLEEVKREEARRLRRRR